MDDPLSGRQPTSHERMTGQPWDASYRRRTCAVGHRRAPAGDRAAGVQGWLSGAVLDAGCGTGENAFTSRRSGCRSWASTSPRRRSRWLERRPTSEGSTVEFVAADALQLERLERTFDTVLDCGLFHTFDADERPAIRGEPGVGDRARRNRVRVVLQRRRPRHRPAPDRPGRAASGVQPENGMECHRHRTRPHAHEIPRRRCTSMDRDDETGVERRASAPVLNHGLARAPVLVIARNAIH